MTGINPDLDSEYEEFDYILYVEKSTRLIFQVKLFEDFAIVRPASPALYRDVRKLTLGRFTQDFEEFCGDHQQVFDFLHRGGDSELEIS